MEEKIPTEFKIKTTLKKLKKLPNGLLTKTLHAMDDYCDYLMDWRLYDLYDEDMLAIIFKGKSPLDLITLGLHAGQSQEFYLTDKYLAVNYDIDKVWTVSESNSDEYYKDRGYDWADIIERLIEIFNHSDSFKNYLPSEVVNILKKYRCLKTNWGHKPPKDTKMKTLDKIITEIEKIAEECSFYNNRINLSVKDNELFIDEMILEGTTNRGKDMVVEYYDIFFDEMLDDSQTGVDNYDVSYETYLWLDNTGHGTRGAPYDMLDCYKDSEEELEHLEDLEHLLRKLDTEL